MPTEYYNHLSPLDHDAYIAKLNDELQHYYGQCPTATALAKEKLIVFLLQRACDAAYQGTIRREGGPFGAMVVDFNNDTAKVVGFGTNHVPLIFDPSAHAEITAIREAAKRLGRTNLRGLTLISSCECCPMCLSAVKGCNIDKVYYAATREDAAAAGFSDAAYYDLMRSGGIEKHAERGHNPDLAYNILNGHQAVVIITNDACQTKYYYGDDETVSHNDPTALPVVQAVRKACVEEKIFHLPDNTVIISRRKPHPLSLMVSVWARVGAIRDIEYPQDPAKDRRYKDVTKIRYIEDTWESIKVYDTCKKETEISPQAIWEEIRHPSTLHIDIKHPVCTLAFEKWNALVHNDEMLKY